MNAKRKRKSKKVAKEDIRISFDVFFNLMVKEGKLGFWQKSEISVFFKQKGLSDLEDKDKYLEILKLY